MALPTSGDGKGIPSVSFACSCTTKAPLTHLFLCQHCIKLRCARCVTHEIESYYCPYCLETMSSAEAKVKKNRCGNCCDCPSCGHTLSTMATTLSQPSATTPDAEPAAGTSAVDQSPTAGKKAYYLRCAVCRWTSRDIGMPDKETASGGYPIKESPAADKVTKLVDLYRRIANMEKAEREQKISSRRRSLLSYTAALDPRFLALHGSAAGQSRLPTVPGDAASTATAASSSQVQTTNSLLGELQNTASQATADLQPLSAAFYTEPLHLETVSTLEQRLASVAFQPVCASVRSADLEGSCIADQQRLTPQHKVLCTRRLQRCKQCEHILNKPDNNPSSIKTRLQLIALHYMPNFRIALLPELRYDEWSKAALTILNPLSDNVAFTLMNLPEEEVSKVPLETAEVELPSSQLIVMGRDDTSEYDDTDADQFQDDPSVVYRRKANRLSFYVKIRPKKAFGPVQASFMLCFKYTSAVQKASQPVQLRQRVDFDFGDMREVHTSKKVAS